MDLAILSWNVRGLNNPAKRRAVQKAVQEFRCNVVCLQETKLSHVNSSLVREILGGSFGDSFIFLPADGTKGGILLACNSDFDITNEPNAVGSYSITGTIRDKSNNEDWSISGVYGPQEEGEKILFLQELRQIQTVVQSRWLTLGDFNMIRRVDEKSSTNVNLRMIGHFRNVIDDLELLKIPLVGRTFTWSSEKQNTVHTKIDRILVTKDWELSFPQYQLRPASTTVSDHCPLILKKMQTQHFKEFRFEQFWIKVPGFKDIVKAAWSKNVISRDAIRRLHIKLSRSVCALKKWHNELKRKSKLSEEIATEIIF